MTPPGKTLRLIHWKAHEARKRVAALRDAGYRVQFEPMTQDTLKQMAARPPHAVVIDLDHLPSHGRDVGLMLRQRKSARHIPIVFLGGESIKVKRIRQQIPDAVFAPWRRMRTALQQALAHPPHNPVAPASSLAGYSGTPLVKKLGIKPDTVLALVSAPPDFDRLLTPMPPSVTIRRSARGRRDLTIWFVTRYADLERRITAMAGAVGEGGLWIAWPKRASGVKTDVSESDVRETGLANGLVDYKICAIDQTWSGLKFARRRQ